MAKRFLCLIVLAVFCFAGSTELMAQVSSSGQLVGTVSDQTGAVIAGATVKIKDNATGAVFETKSSAEGHFAASNLRPGEYTVTVSMTGFKGAEFRAVKVTIGQVYDLGVKLEVGALESTVVVEAGAEVLETASTTIGTSITGKQITQLPLSSRNTLDLAILMPGASSPTGSARNTSFLGLPKGAINITLDGINAQDNTLKSSDGFFLIVNARLDSVEEFSISTAGQGAEQSGQGAVQIRFETKRGGNVYHGGAWWYHRNDFFNSNYWFNNRDGLARQRQRLNQFGGQVGGPIWKEKMFFFVSEDNYRDPGSITRSRTILSTNSLLGKYDYVPSGTFPTAALLALHPWVTCVANSPRNPTGGSLCTSDLLAYAAAVGLPNTLDTTSMGLLNAVNAARTATGVAIGKVATPWIDPISFNNSFGGTRRFPDIRLDYNITKNIQWTGIYHYNYFASSPDTLNNADATFPVAPFNKNTGAQLSNRNEWVTSVRWNIGSNKSNEVRAGLTTSPVSFFPDLDLAGFYPNADTNLGSVRIRQAYTATITNPIQGYGTQGRNGGIMQVLDTFSWSKGKHNLMFGGDWTRIRFLQYLASRAVNTATMSLPTADPASGLIGNTAFDPITGAMTGSPLAILRGGTSDPGNAQNLYAYLLGRVGSYAGTISAQPASKTYVPTRPQFTSIRQNEFGFYGTDSWRIHPQLTFNYGLRWELQKAPYDPYQISFRTQGGMAGVWGISGLNNLFKYGTTTGSIPIYEPNGSRKWYEDDMNNFAPNVGLAWSPSFSNKMWKTMFGEAGKSVFRATYSVNYTREGTSNFSSIAFSNPGIDGSIFSTAVAPGAAAGLNCTGITPPFSQAGSFPAGCLTLSGLFAGDLQSLITSPATFPTAPFQITAQSGQSVNMFEPHLGTPVVHNWSVGIQREISPSMVVEVRYVGNHGAGLWRQDNINERNIFENNFLPEFGNAQINLATCRANPGAAPGPGPVFVVPAAGTCRAQQIANGVLVQNTSGASFANWGVAGQVPVPIMTQMLAGSGTLNAARSNFTNSNFVLWLDNGAAGSFANNVAFNTTFLCNLVGLGGAPLQGASATNPCSAVATTPAGATGYPVNFWVANPHANGGAFRFNNNTHTNYNGLTVEVRKRYSKGLQFSGNYTFSKSLTNYYGNDAASFSSFTTLRNPSFDKAPSPWDIRHAFKFNMIYSFPFGPGRKWSSSHGWLNHVIEGWDLSAVNRWQSGSVFQLTSGGNNLTVNQFDPGVILNGISIKQIQHSLSIRKLPTGTVYYFPATLISSTGTSNAAAIAPCNTAGKLCQKVSLYGPSFIRTDINIVKRVKFYERYEFEYRAEFLNAFNNINFLYPGTGGGSASVAGTTFGQVTASFRDQNATNDFGGRIIQMVIRIRF